LDCPSHCDVCIDGNVCTTCSPGSYFYKQACYETCPTVAPYRSPTVDNTLCYRTCPPEAPYISNNICERTSPPGSPSLEENSSSHEDPDSIMSSAARINNAAESTANTLLISRNIFSISATGPFMFGSIAKLLQYARHLDISRSENLEAIFQAEEDSGNYIPMPKISKDPTEKSNNLPFVFEKYGVSSSFLLNQGNNLLRLLTIFGVLIVVSLLQKGLFYTGKVPLACSAALKTRFFFQNYFIGQFYEIQGDIAFCLVLELKAVVFADSSSVVSLIVCISCMILAGALFVANIWIVRKYQESKKICEKDDGKLNFCERYKGIRLLFNDFEDATFTHQGLLIFFAGRNILFCLIIALFYKSPVVQSVLLLIINLAIIGYYTWKKSIKCRLGYVEQVIYELILFSVSACFFIMALADRSESTSEGLIRILSGVILVLNILLKLIALAFLTIRFALYMWKYRQILKRILKNIMKRKGKTAAVAPLSLKKTVDSDQPPTGNPEKNFDISHAINITEQNIMPENSFALDQSSVMTQPEASSDKLYAPTESQLFGDNPFAPPEDEISEDKCYAPTHEEVFRGVALDAQAQELNFAPEESSVEVIFRRGAVSSYSKAGRRPIN